MRKLIFILILFMGLSVQAQTVVDRYERFPQSTFDGIFEFLFNDNLTETTGNHPATNINGTMTYVTGPNSNNPKAANFDGTDYFDLASSADFSTTDFTIAFWMYKPTSWPASWGCIIQHDRFGNNWYTITLDGDIASSITWRWASGGSFGDTFWRRGTRSADTWYHYIITVDTNDVRIYENGTEIRNDTSVTLGTANASAIRIGAITPSGEAYVGYLSRLQFWNTSKNATECGQIYTDAQ